MNELTEKGIELPSTLSKAAIKRQCEFVAGRYCASLCLAELGLYHPQTLPICSSREPDWPEDIVGSISHCDSLAVAIAKEKHEGASGLGVDIEVLIKSETALQIKSRIISADEESYANYFESFAHYLTSAFSAKEALYKALYPQVKQFLDFDSAIVTRVQPDQQNIVLTLTKDLNKKFYKGKSLSIQYDWLKNDRLQTICILD